MPGSSHFTNLILCKVYPEIKHRIIYGSDYTLLLLFKNNFDNNVKQFRELFDADFDIIAATIRKFFEECNLKHRNFISLAG